MVFGASERLTAAFMIAVTLNSPSVLLQQLRWWAMCNFLYVDKCVLSKLCAILLCLSQFTQTATRRNVTDLSVCSFVRSSFAKLVNMIFWKWMNQFCCKLAHVVHMARGWLWGSRGQRSRSHDAKVRFWGLRRVALSCAPVRALLRTHGLESTLMQRCAHGSAPVGALPWALHALCASDWLNFVLICNIADGLLDYTEVIAYLATHSQTNTYQSPFSTKSMTFIISSTTRTSIVSSAMMDCSITSLCHVAKSTGATFFCDPRILGALPWAQALH